MLRVASRSATRAGVLRAAPAQIRGFAAGTVTELKTKDEFLAAKQSIVPTGAAIFDFSAVWCGPCKMIAPVYEALAEETPEVKFFKIDIDNPEMSEAVSDSDIASVPTFVAYKNGSFVNQFSGADRQKLKALVDVLSK